MLDEDTAAAVTSSRDMSEPSVTSDVTDDVVVSDVSATVVDKSAAVDVSCSTSPGRGAEAAGLQCPAVPPPLSLHADDVDRPGPPAPPRSVCRVCADDAAGMYFGALVCVPCKVPQLRAGTGSVNK